MSFSLTEEQAMIKQMAREFAENEIIPHAEHYDKTHEYPRPVVEKAQELGLTLLNIPEEYGGLGLSLVEEMIVAEELSYGCSGIGLSITINCLAALPIVIAGNEEQKQKYLGKLVDGGMAAYCVTEPEAGSDVAALQTTAVKDGDDYIINGTKTFITGATVADWFTVFAYTDKEKRHNGVSAFVIEKGTPGLSVGKPFDKLGQCASDTAEVVLENVRVPASNMLGKEGYGFMIAMKVFDRSRPSVGSMAVGIARRAMEEAIKYAAERKTMGKPIYRHQAIGHMIADMAMQIEAARLLVRKAAWQYDNDESNVMSASMAKAFAADMAMKVTTDAVQVLGGYGYMREYPVEKLMRDVKVCQIYEGTSQIQRNILVRELFKNS
ncbi:acyl-CoA dehydrogenase family protein [Anaerolineales bacterium HSG6]|nr:acyl-CoA dehydrogenase family protein [Anaerolineales bacterium HSG6]MDM8530441.1 acyl-CoA dehydrogenase family protein [Anaerolineales bacterium HSG25]